jgi:hypothetical protein
MTIDDLRRLLRPLQTRISNLAARAVVQLVDDSTKQQLVQIGVLAGEDIDDGEHFHPYGFTSVPLPGAEAVVLFPGGDRGHPLVVAVADRRHRPTGGQPGEVTLYADTGAKIRLLADGSIEVVPGAGGEVRFGAGGASDPVALKSDLSALLAAINSAIGVVPGAATGPAELNALKSALAALLWPVSSTKVKAV